MTEQPTCVPGCMRFDGGETKHHPSCPFYAESLTKWNADRIAALEGALREVVALSGNDPHGTDPTIAGDVNRIARAALQENDQ